MIDVATLMLSLTAMVKTQARRGGTYYITSSFLELNAPFTRIE